MSELPSRADAEAATQRARLIDFTDGFKREAATAGDRIVFDKVELRAPIEGDEKIIFVHFEMDGKRAIGAVEYHLPDAFASYDELGEQCCRQVIAERDCVLRVR